MPHPPRYALVRKLPRQPYAGRFVSTVIIGAQACMPEPHTCPADSQGFPRGE
jgi:hypothetical protein